MPDQILVCIEAGCGKEFTFTENDQAFYADKGYTPPKRCKPCRAINKQRLAERGVRVRR